jgi:hypothetical protein
VACATSARPRVAECARGGSLPCRDEILHGAQISLLAAPRCSWMTGQPSRPIAAESIAQLSKGVWLSESTETSADPSPTRPKKTHKTSQLNRQQSPIGGEKLRPVDMPWHGEPVFNSRARKVLEPLLLGCGQFLALRGTSEPLWVFNVTNVIQGALKEEESDIERIHTGKVLFVRRHEFDLESVAAQPIFKVPQLPVRPFFVDDSIREAVESAQLTGWDFTPIWDSVQGGVEQSFL